MNTDRNINTKSQEKLRERTIIIIVITSLFHNSQNVLNIIDHSLINIQGKLNNRSSVKNWITSFATT